MDGTEFDLLLVGFRNELARGRVLTFLRERAQHDGTPTFPFDLHLPHTLLAQVDFQTANSLSVELTQCGALVRLARPTLVEVRGSPATIVGSGVLQPIETPRAENHTRPLLQRLAMSALRVSLAVVLVVMSSTFFLSSQRLSEVSSVTAFCQQRVDELRWAFSFFSAPFVSADRQLQMTRADSEPRFTEPERSVGAASTIVARGQNDEINRLIAQKSFATALARVNDLSNHPAEDPNLLVYLDRIYTQWIKAEIEEGHLDGALGVIQQAIEIKNTPSLLAQQGEIYLKKGNRDAARTAYEKALALGGKNGAACLALADIYRQLGDQNTAVAMLDRAREYGAKGPEFDAMMQLIVREQAAESGFASLKSAHFNVSFAQGQDHRAAQLILTELERAYQVVGQKLSSYPDHVTPVVLYDSEDFQRVTQSPDWAGAIYDGRIKVPVSGLDANDARLAGILRHEYAHVLNLLVAGENCPVWLNEGVAMWAQEAKDGEGESIATAVVGLNRPFKLVDLEKSFIHLSPQEAGIAYSQAYLAVRYIVRRYGELTLHRLLAAFAHTSVTQDAFRETLDLDLSTLEQELHFQPDATS